MNRIRKWYTALRDYLNRSEIDSWARRQRKIFDYIQPERSERDGVDGELEKKTTKLPLENKK